MSSTNPDSKPANLITALRLRSGQAWTQRDWCWIVFLCYFCRELLPLMCCTSATTSVIMTTDKLAGKTHYLWRKFSVGRNFLQNREKGNHNAQANGVYLNRTSGGDFRHCLIDGNLDARPPASQETGQSRGVSIEPATVGSHLLHVRQRQPRDSASPHIVRAIPVAYRASYLLFGQQ